MINEELKKEMDAKYPPIEVSKDDFADAIIKALENKRIKKTLNINPIIGLGLVVVGAGIVTRIFCQEADFTKKIVLTRSVYDKALVDEIMETPSKDPMMPLLLTAFGLVLGNCLWGEEEKHEASGEDAIVGNNAAAVNSEC